MSQNREFIVQWFKEAIASDALNETQEESQIPEVQTGGALNGTQGDSQIPEVQTGGALNGTQGGSQIPEGEVPIQVNTFAGGHMTIYVFLGSKCWDWKRKIQYESGFAIHQFHVLIGGRWIPEYSILRDYGVKKRSTIDLLLQ
jgi:hypothetical protein